MIVYDEADHNRTLRDLCFTMELMEDKLDRMAHKMFWFGVTVGIAAAIAVFALAIALA